eukprot:1404333-Rhodomonas_salina.3
MVKSESSRLKLAARLSPPDSKNSSSCSRHANSVSLLPAAINATPTLAQYRYPPPTLGQYRDNPPPYPSVVPQSTAAVPHMASPPYAMALLDMAE